MSIAVTVILRNILYIGFGQGLDYLLHDGETQLVAVVLLAEQLAIGTIILGLLTMLHGRS